MFVWIGLLLFCVVVIIVTIMAIVQINRQHALKQNGKIKAVIQAKKIKRQKKDTQQGDISNKCKRCRKRTLGIDEYVKKVEQQGWTVHPLTQKPQPPSGFVGYISKLVDLENQRGFRCKKCGRIYCMDCLFSHAPDHSNGGKACFKCGGAFEVLA